MMDSSRWSYQLVVKKHSPFTGITPKSHTEDVNGITPVFGDLPHLFPWDRVKSFGEVPAKADPVGGFVSVLGRRSADASTPDSVQYSPVCLIVEDP
jgi:hypothetical protein